MRTRDTDYGRFFPLEDGGFPEDYPFDDKFHFHIARMGQYLRNVKADLTSDELFLREIRKYKRLGFMTFYKKCMAQYDRILNLRMEKLEENME
jgi:hypothetical protein